MISQERRPYYLSPTLLAFLVSLLVVGCDSGGEPVAGIDRGGQRSPVTSVGKITGFGSVVVNGVRWDTNSAQIFVDGNPGTEADLSIGQIVRVEGLRSDQDDGIANSIEADDLLQGVIEEIDGGAGELIVLRQRVTVNNQTAFGSEIMPSSLNGLSVGDRVEISGFFDENANILVTHIELDDDADDEDEITGVVENLDIGDFAFEIHGLLVDYSQAVLIELPDGAPENGKLVEVKGVFDAARGVFIATELDTEDLFDDFDDGDELEVEGLITRFASSDDFDLAGISVTTTARTEYDNGTAADLAEGVLVEIEGTMNLDAVLVAKEVEFEEADDSAGSDDSNNSDDDSDDSPDSDDSDDGP